MHGNLYDIKIRTLFPFPPREASLRSLVILWKKYCLFSLFNFQHQPVAKLSTSVKQSIQSKACHSCSFCQNVMGIYREELCPHSVCWRPGKENRVRFGGLGRKCYASKKTPTLFLLPVSSEKMAILWATILYFIVLKLQKIRRLISSCAV